METGTETNSPDEGRGTAVDTSGWDAPADKTSVDASAEATWEEPSTDTGWGEPSSTSGWETEPSKESKAKGKSPSNNNKEKDRDKERKPRDKPGKPKITGYIRPETEKKEKMSPEEVEAMMERMKLKNDQIREQRERVAADEDAFNAKVTEERARQLKLREERQARSAAQRKVQANIDNEREENARRKLAKLGQREWDSQKQNAPERKERPLKGLGRGSPISGGDGVGLRLSNTPAVPEKDDAPQLPELEKGGEADEWAAATAAAAEQW